MITTTKWLKTMKRSKLVGSRWKYIFLGIFVFLQYFSFTLLKNILKIEGKKISYDSNNGANGIAIVTMKIK